LPTQTVNVDKALFVNHQCGTKWMQKRKLQWFGIVNLCRQANTV